MRSMLPQRWLSFVVLLAITAHACADDNWPQWRGPDQNGVSSATDLATTWSETENIVWKVPLPSWSGGTPIVWGDRIFVTSASAAETQPAAAAAEEPPAPSAGRQGRGRRGRRTARDPGGPNLLLICLSKTDGSQLWEQVLGDGNELLQKQNNSSPSPVTDGQHVWVVTGTGVVSAFDLDGNPVWQKNLQEEYGPFGLNWGYASSPLLYEGKLIIEVLHGMNTDDPSYIVAFDAANGSEIWREERPTDARRESPDAYTTPVIVEHEGAAELVITGGDYVTGHDPATGKEIWRAAGLNPNREGNYRIVASPVAVDGMVYAPTRERPFLAVAAGGRGDVTAAWKYEGAGAPDVPTPACDGKYLYLVGDEGIVVCLDAKTGTKIWGPERTTAGTVSASPLLADGKLFVTNEQGVTTVLAAGPEFQKLATNQLDAGYTLSSPVAVGSQLFLRGETHLYCIGSATN